MYIVETILNFLNTKMTTPVPYGGFHLFFFLLSFLGGIILCKCRKNADEHFVRGVLLVTSLTVIALEVYKQINFSFSVQGNEILFDYQWYAFPFQFCSTPMYIGLLAALTKKKTLHRSLCAYLGTYSLFAGLCVMFYPISVFTNTVGINIQTMICHGSMVSIGICLLYSGYVKTELSTIRDAFPVFLTLLLMAAVMNEIAFLSGLLKTETFNMFFISPHCAPELPVYSMVQKMMPFPACLIVYAVAFTAAGCMLLVIVACTLKGPRRISASLRRAYMPG